MNRGTGISRRDLLKGSLFVGGQWLVGCTTLRSHGEGDREPAQSGNRNVALHTWILVSTEGQFQLLVPRTEMGQGVFTGHAMLMAEELGLEVSDIYVHFAPWNNLEFRNPAFDLNATGGSTSTTVAWLPLRQAAAGVREVLLMAAAQELSANSKTKVLAAQCRLQKSKVVAPDGRNVPVGSLVEKASKLPFPRNPQMTNEKFRVIGQPLPRTDLYEKITGRAQYGIDVQIPGLVHCFVIRCPVLKGKLKKFDATLALQRPGVVQVLPLSLGVAVLANSFWQAITAAKLVQIEWDYPERTRWSNETFRASQLAALETQGLPTNFATLVPHTQKDNSVTSTYELPYLPHSQLEPLNCTVRIEAGVCDIWIGSQIPAAAIEIAQKISGVGERNVRYHHTFIGGSFGRRLHHDFLVEALEVAKLTGFPIKNIWTREKEFRHDFFRPASVHRLSGWASGKGRIESWHHHIVAPSIFGYSSDEMVQALIPKWVPDKLGKYVGKFYQGGLKGVAFDPTAVEGARVLPYIPKSMNVEYSHHAPALPIGFWRSVGYGPNSFVVESFIDELAANAKVDPMEFRLRALEAALSAGGIARWEMENKAALEKIGAGLHKNASEIPVQVLSNPALKDAEPERSLAVVRMLKEKSRWGQGTLPGLHRGVAQAFCFGSYCAAVVDVTIEKKQIKVVRVTAVVDCGLVVNPDIARAQIEGGIVFALSAALKQEITFSDSTVKEASFAECDILRMFESPQIDVYFVKSDQEPGGVGELGVPAIAPALCNAIFAATGKRIYRLPIRL